MIRKLTILILILQPLIAKCDFADYWIVSLNDSIIYDSRNDDSSYYKTATIFLSDIKLTNSDTLKINYLTDTPCPNCNYSLLITDKEKNKVLYLTKIGFDKDKPQTDPLAFVRQTNKYGEFFLFKSDIEKLKNKGQLEVYFSTSRRRYLREILKIE